jgi:hypothetical protein
LSDLPWRYVRGPFHALFRSTLVAGWTPHRASCRRRSGCALLASRYAYFLPDGSLNPNSALLWRVLMPACAGAIIIFLFLRVFSREMVIARWRAGIRRRAIDGTPDDMPVATIAVETSHAPDNTQEPLVLAWRLSAGRRWSIRATLLFLLLICLGNLVLAYWLLFSLSPRLFKVLDPTVAIAIGVLTILALGGLLLALSAFVFVTLDHPFTRPSTVTFSGDGVHERTRWGGRRTVRWEQARLLEVRFASAPFKSYLLYGADGTFVRWFDSLPSTFYGTLHRSGFTPIGISDDEMARRLRDALVLIANATGLRPHTFEKRLQADPSSAALPIPVARRRAGVVSLLILLLPLLLVFVGFPLGVGIYVLIGRPVTDVTLNLVSGTFLVLGGVLLLGWLCVDALRARLRRQTLARTDPLLLSDTQLDAPHTYDLLLLQSWHEAALTFLIPLLLCSGGVFGLLGMIEAGRGLDPQWTMTVVLLGVYAVASAAALAARLRIGLRSVTRIQATPEGLRSHSKRQRLFTPWQQVESMRMKTIQGRPSSYAASADQGRMIIEWNANAPPARPRDGNIAVGAAALAQVIERRAGVTLVNEELSETPM